MSYLATEQGPRSFPPTDWAHLLRLQDTQHPDLAATLDRLARQYWNPVYHYIRALTRTDTETAKDRTQQFFTQLVSRNSLQQLSADRGSFRGFLKISVKNFLISAHRSDRARQPRDGAHLVPLDPTEPDQDLPVVAQESLSPEETFDREWARQILIESVETLEGLYQAEGKETHFQLFREYCVIPSGASSETLDSPPPSRRPTYDELAARHDLAAHDIGNSLRVSRKRLRDLLRRRVECYLDAGQDAEAELSFLLGR